MAYSLEQLLAKLPTYDVTFLKHSAKEAGKVERKYNKRFEDMISSWNAYFSQFIMDDIKSERQPDFSFVHINAIEYLLLSHKFDSLKAGIETAANKDPSQTRLARSLRIPKSFADLMVWWDKTRKNKAPLYIQRQAKVIKKRYLKKCQSVWEKYSRLFRSGQTFTQKEVIKDVTIAGQTTLSRAKTIVNTETTRYYNEVRVQIYNQSDAITHYLFVAIRDYRTTTWCNDRNGLVYDKDSAIFAREQPPIHYNCRSEVLPLSPYNPEHKQLISNSKLRRENNKCKPLLPKWNEKL